MDFQVSTNRQILHNRELKLERNLDLIKLDFFLYKNNNGDDHDHSK